MRSIAIDGVCFDLMVEEDGPDLIAHVSVSRIESDHPSRARKHIIPVPPAKKLDD